MTREDILKEIGEMNKRIGELTEMVNNMEDDKNKYWVPEQFENYYFIHSNGEIMDITNTNVTLDTIMIENLNAFKTKEEAERMQFEQLLYRKLKKFAYENNKEFKAGNNYYICYGDCYKELDVDCEHNGRSFGEVYFSSREIAERAIEEFKDELLKYFEEQ